MALEMSKERLQRYFSNITYIDDKFDHCFLQSGLIDFEENYSEPNGIEDEQEGPPLTIEDTEVQTNSSEETEDPHNPQGSLIQILAALNQEEFSGIMLTPVLYSEGVDEEILCKKVLQSPLTLIDWKLGEQITAFSLVNKVFTQSRQLKVIVVYTASFDQAKNELDSNPDWQEKVERLNTEKFYCCSRNKTSLLILADKQANTIIDIINKVVSLFIDIYGVMPVSVLDYMNSIQGLSDDLFSSFAAPSESLFHLQIYKSEVDDFEISQSMTEFIQNRVRAECSVSPQLVDELLEQQKLKLTQFTGQDDASAGTRLTTVIQKLSHSFSGNDQKFVLQLKQCAFSNFKNCCTAAVSSHTWGEFYNSFTPLYEEAEQAFCKTTVENHLVEYKTLLPEDKYNKLVECFVKKEHASSKENLFPIFSQILPLVIQSLLTLQDYTVHGPALIHTLKLISYPSSNLCELLAGGRGLSKNERTAFWQNKLHFGDILYKQEDNKYLLCITPPCDTFRLAKVNFNILYIRGYEIPSANVNQTSRRENMHISALPFNDNGREKIKYIQWNLFEIQRFNLSKDEDYDELISFDRPYRMSEQYARQIANQFIAYFSRAGVDEVFFKAEKHLRKIFN